MLKRTKSIADRFEQKPNKQNKPKKKKLNTKKKSNNIKSLKNYLIEPITQKKRIKGQPTQFLQARKQSIINSCMNKRKRNLIEITKQNHRLFKRINSQQSQYCSQKSINRSYISNKSISASRCQKKGKLDEKGRKFFRKSCCKSSRNLQKIQSQNIKDIEKCQIQDFTKMFQVKSDILRPQSASLIQQPNHSKNNHKIKQKPIEEQIIEDEGNPTSFFKGKSQTYKIYKQNIDIQTKKRRVLSAVPKNRIQLTQNVMNNLRIKYR